jgi:glucuronate isomerase
MSKPLALDDDRLFPADAGVRRIARSLHERIGQLPIISPHGHTDPAWFSENKPFDNAADLLVTPDHYVLRMLYSQGIALERLGVALRHGKSQTDPRDAWRLFAANFHLFRGTPSALWLNYVFAKVFEIDVRLEAGTADHYFDVIAAKLKQDAFRPRALFERFNIEVLSTTEGPDDKLDHHRAMRKSGWPGRVVPTYRPDTAIDPEHESFQAGLAALAERTNTDVMSWQGYLEAHRLRRADFIAMGATATDHGHATAATADMSAVAAEALFKKVVTGKAGPDEAELFRAQMLTEMARMSLDDGLVMQIHPGVYRNHNAWVMEKFGRDKGGDIPQDVEYVRALKPLLDRFGNDPNLTVILFTLDESTYSRELAPLAGHYPALKLGPAWWFHDSPEGMMRFREMTTGTAGFYNTVGFNDDTRAFLSIPARHDVARRVDCAFLARLVGEHRLDLDEAHEVARDLAYELPKRAYKFDRPSRAR